MADQTNSSSSGLNSIVLLKDSNLSVQDWTSEKDHEKTASIFPSLHHPSLSAVKGLVYWQEPKKSALVFGGSMLVLTSLASFSVISVVSYLLLALLCVTITFRVYKSVVQAVQKSDEGHPFKVLMERDISISPDTARRYMDIFLVKLNTALVQIRRLVLVEDVVDSLKLAVVMWFLTCVGAVFNGITLLILADIILFCTPLLYERNKTQIDGYLLRVQAQLEQELAKLQDKLPGPLKRRKAE
ncbi:reticulon-3-B-like isoform X2 [Megalobrama amblycephala]|uniref:reticulon-3-B-like isoform X2 n=1 Tax=Megalobrama amblycephala TaxID=75352 RepID=UPI002013F357|nr:reticulon-3-B-like isoform X2 [Megalobrama amblycephala]